MSTKPLFLLRKAKKSSGEPDVVLWASNDFESTCATLDYLIVKSGKKLSSYFKAVATNFPVVNDLPAEGEIDFTWSVARLKDGGTQFEVMTRKQIELVRSLSKAGNNGPWVTHWEEMAKKTAIRRLFKYLPVSIEIQRAVSMDEKEPLTIDPADSSVLTGEYSVIDNSEE
ncbi:TPA: recombinase RecT [Escherichia coli]|nr:recombinase RecT [Escherichia coli]